MQRRMNPNMDLEDMTYKKRLKTNKQTKNRERNAEHRRAGRPQRPVLVLTKVS